METVLISWFEALVLGVVQGLTEFLPISSSAHVFIVSEFFGWGDPGAAFTAVTQIGTETAVIIYFRKDIAKLFKSFVGWFRTPETRGSSETNLVWAIVWGSLPIGVIGFLAQDIIESDIRNLDLVASMLILFGAFLILVERIKIKPRGELTLRSGILMGFAQALALIPGVSRSGATITAGLALGLSRESATRYAFLLAIPAVMASGFLEAFKISGSAVAWGPTLLATAISSVVGYAVIAGLLNFLKNHSFAVFGIYRIFLGLLIFVVF